MFPGPPAAEPVALPESPLRASACAPSIYDLDVVPRLVHAVCAVRTEQVLQAGPGAQTRGLHRYAPAQLFEPVDEGGPAGGVGAEPPHRSEQFQADARLRPG